MLTSKFSFYGDFPVLGDLWDVLTDGTFVDPLLLLVPPCLVGDPLLLRGPNFCESLEILDPILEIPTFGELPFLIMAKVCTGLSLLALVLMLIGPFWTAWIGLPDFVKNPMFVDGRFC